MRLKDITENRWVQITGGANSLRPGYEYPWSHPHQIHEPIPTGWMHGTTDLLADSIMAQGLHPAPGKKNHVTKSRKLALHIARRMAENHGGRPIILHVDFSGTKIDLHGSTLDSHTRDIIPPSAITIETVRRRHAT